MTCRSRRPFKGSVCGLVSESRQVVCEPQKGNLEVRFQERSANGRYFRVVTPESGIQGA